MPKTSGGRCAEASLHHFLAGTGSPEEARSTDKSWRSTVLLGALGPSSEPMLAVHNTL